MKQLLTVLFIGLLSTAYAQDTPPLITEENPDLGAQVDYILENLDMSPVTSNLLLDRGFRMREIGNLTGASTSDTLSNFDDWAAVHMSLYTSAMGSPHPLGTPDPWSNQADQLMDAGVIPLIALHVGYHQFLEDSVLLSTRIVEDDGQLYDIWSGSNTPYEYKVAFACAPYQSQAYDKLSHTFRFQPQFHVSNQSASILSIQVDFDNGQGFQNLTSGVNKAVSWASYGTKIITTRITYTNGMRESKVRFELINSFPEDVGYSGAKFSSTWEDSIYVPHPTLSNHGVGLTMSYGCNHESLVKPFIYVEGFNPEEFEGSKLNYRKFFRKLAFYPSEFQGGYPLLTELENNGYDIVYIDFEQGSGDLTYNASALAEAIKEINAIKAANGSTEPNVLVGESMGGLVARLALRYLENAGIDPEVDYYVSIDAPHRGAHIPEAFKWCFLDLYNYKYMGIQIAKNFESMRNANTVFHSPAARQMLRYGTDYSAFIGLQNHMDGLGMPSSTIQNIAIANGNGSGTNQGFSTMAPMLDVDLHNFNALSTFGITSSFWSWMAGLGAAGILGTHARIKLDLNAQPGTVPDFLEIYKRSIFLRVLWLVPQWSTRSIKVSNRIPLDGAPGGAYDLDDVSTNEIKIENFYGSGRHLYFTLAELAPTWSPGVQLHLTKFSFIPTASALNCQSLFPTPFVPIDPTAVVANNITTFDKVHVLDPTLYPSSATAPVNEVHLAYTPSSIGPFEAIISPGVSTNLSGINTDGQVVNFGSNTTANEVTSTSRFIKNLVTIGSTQNATLGINCLSPLGSNLQSANPISNAEQFKVQLTKTCFGTTGRIRVQANGILKIGENSMQRGILIVEENSWIKLNDGLIEVREGSKLIIESGAELRLNGGQVKVYDGGEIIVKAGGLLIYEDGVNLELNGNDAQLALGGHTHIGDNATFQFSWQGSESGYVRLLKEGHWGQRFSAGFNASVRLEGNGNDDLILLMEEGVDFWEYSEDDSWEYSQSDNFQDYADISEAFTLVLFQDGKI